MGILDRLLHRATETEVERPDPMEQARRRILENPNDATAHFDLGSLYYVHRRYEDAVQELTRATELAPDHADAYYILGLAYAKLGRIDEARRAFASARDKTDNAMLQNYATVKLQELEPVKHVG
jgi:Flp pilus assembly protein TadD